jgi:membrane protein YqaA with SNARE-associated domain
MVTQSRAQKIILASSLLVLITVPIVIIALGLNLRGIAEYGYLGVFGASLISNATIIVPVPGGAVMVLAATMFNPAWVALAAAGGAALGQCTAYFIGFGGRATVGQDRAQRYQKAENWMRRYGSGTILLLSVLPFIPFDFVGIAAGTLRFPFWKFFLALLTGRLIRAFVEVYVIWTLFPNLS